MKSILSVLVVLSFVMSTAFAGVADVQKEVSLLGKLAMGSSEYTVSGSTAKEIMDNLQEQQYGEAEELVNKEFADMNQGDETNAGFTSSKSAQKMNAFAIGVLEEQMENDLPASQVNSIKAKISDLNKDWATSIKRLEHLGVKFAYSGNGPGYCGMTFIKLIIIDENNHKAYDVYLSTSDEC